MGRMASDGRARMRRLAVLLLACVLVLPAPVRAEHPDVARRKAVERKTFTDTELADGFFRVAFGAEMHRGGRVDLIRKYEKPVRVYLDPRGNGKRRAEVARVLADIRSRIAHLDIDVASKRSDANVIVTLVRERDFPRAIGEIYGQKQSRRIIKSLEPQCLSGFRKDADFRIVQSNVILVVDVDDFTFLDCAYEEMLQALGPINDDSALPWTMFNDNVQMGFFGIFDQFILNILYHPRIRAGMRPDQVRALLPDILPEVKAFVAKTNGLQR
jgi:hypothetical protein